MITVKQAQQLISKNIPPLQRTMLPISEALGYILAEEVYAPFPLPVFDNSAMDGFVLRASDTQKASPTKPVRLRIKETIKAGDSSKNALRSGEAYRIMTGALIPMGADTVLPKEEVILQNGSLLLNHSLKKGRHIRYQGEEIQKGERVLRKNILIGPGTIGFLSSIGKSKIKVFNKPNITLIATGSELIRTGHRLPQGKIYDSNSVMISSALEKMGIHPSSVQTVPDNVGILTKSIRQAIQKSDLVILMGGVSAGDYDYVKEILRQLGVRDIFWKVSQKPGKPIFFGRKGRKLVFGLPGNPASVFTCFYEYVYPAIRRMMGYTNPNLPKERFRLAVSIKPDSSKVLFLKGKIISNSDGKEAIPLIHQGSHMISSLYDCDGFIVIPPGGAIVKKWGEVEVHLLP